MVTGHDPKTNNVEHYSNNLESPGFDTYNAPQKPLIVRLLCNQTVFVIICAIIGFGVGIGLSNGRGSEDLINWISLPGELFLRALKCVVFESIIEEVLI